jgi:Sister chromatid cohesion protein Dcc1
MRAITVSNTFLVVTAGGDADTNNGKDTTESIYVQSELSHILEITPTIAKVERLRALLRDSQYDERIEDGDSDEDEVMEVDDQLQRKVRFPAHANTSVPLRHGERNAIPWKRFGH